MCLESRPERMIRAYLPDAPVEGIPLGGGVIYNMYRSEGSLSYIIPLFCHPSAQEHQGMAHSPIGEN